MKKYSRREIGNLFVCFLVLVVLVACSGKNSLPALSEQSLPLMSSDSNKAKESETMTDHRDGQVYKTVKIGSQIWMAENLNYETESSYCYENRMSNCLKYGRLYTWTPALSACPAGWHLPTQSDWNELFRTLGGKVSAAMALKSTKEWNSATNSSGFSALLSGSENLNGEFSSDGKTFFWGSDYYNDSLAYYMGLLNGKDEATLLAENKGNKYSVRCLKDDPLAKNEFVGKKALPIGQTNQQFVDVRDGKVYKTVTYGKQTWMAEDLAFEAEFDDDCLSFYCRNIGSYTWKTAMGDAYTQENRKEPVRGVCPIGWHLPDTTEWRNLISVLGGVNEAYKVLESTSGNGFSMVANDNTIICSEDSVENVCGMTAAFWSSDKDSEDPDYAHQMLLVAYSNGKKELEISSERKRSDMPIRCVMDEVAQEKASIDGAPVGAEQIKNTVAMDSVVDSRDGQTYRTTKIGD